MFDLILLALLCGLVVMACIAAVWLAMAARVRRQLVIPVHPRLVDTFGEQVPAELKTVLATVVPALERLGFTSVANMHAPQLSAMFTWTQVLFIHRERGERASVLYLCPANPARASRAGPTLGFATEWADGRAVKTMIAQPTEAAVVEAYDRHRRHVEAQQLQTGQAARGVVPDVGQEAEWLRERAGRIAASIARRSSFVLDPDGENYRLTWRRALRAAWVGLWMKRRGRDRGFDVIAPPPKSDTPSPDDP